MTLREAVTVPDSAGDDDVPEKPSQLGHFELGRCLGSGGMGVVFEARDTLLHRAVALKLLRPGADEAGRARLLREAQTLARLSHPNVVTVFEVGIAASPPGAAPATEQVFAAMELVDGATLRDWMKQAHGWRAVVDLFLAAGRGLAAVHSLGLVHRDFKPANVLIDRAGTPKVGDFGLVGTDGGPTLPAASTLPAIAREHLTQTGSIMGTPAYMAPEQRRGERIDARADQYAFAVSLVEAVTGKRPDEHDTPAATETSASAPTSVLTPRQTAALARGSRVGAPSIAALPKPLRAIAARALEDDPEKRYPSMNALLAELARARRGRARWWLGGGGVVAVGGAIALAWSLGRTGSDAAAPPACPIPEARIGAVWSPAKRDAVQAHLIAIDPTYGAARFTTAAATLDRGATRWSDMHVEACRANRVEGRQSDTLLDRRMACLDRGLVELDATVAVLAGAADPAALDRAMRAVVGLPSLDPCADVGALTERLPLPSGEARAEFDAIARELAAIDVSRRVDGKLAGLEQRAASAVERARRLGHPPTLADALRSLVVIQAEHEAFDAVLATQREIVQVAAAAHDDAAVALAWTSMLGVLAEPLKRPDEAEALVPSAAAAVVRAGDRIELRVELLGGTARIARARGDHDRASALFAEQIALLQASGAAAPGSSLAELLSAARREVATTLALAGKWGEAATAFRTLVEIVVAQLGPDHADTLRAQFNLGVSLRHLGNDEEALTAFRAAAAIGEARLAPSPSLASVVHAVGSTLAQMGRQAEALPYLERAVAMARATMGPGDPRLAKPVADLGAALDGLGRYDEARPLFVEQIAILEKVGTPDDDWANALWNLGNLEVKVGRCDAAKPPLERAIEMYRAKNGIASADARQTRALLEELRARAAPASIASMARTRRRGSGFHPVHAATARRGAGMMVDSR